MIGICKLSDEIRRSVEMDKTQNKKLSEIDESIRHIYDALNVQERKLNERQKETNNNNIEELQRQLDEIKDKNKDVVSVGDLNAVIQDVHESFMIFLNNTPRSDVNELREEIKLLKSELVKLKDATPMLISEIKREALEIVDDKPKIKKLDLPKKSK